MIIWSAPSFTDTDTSDSPSVSDRRKLDVRAASSTSSPLVRERRKVEEGGEETRRGLSHGN